MTTEYSIQKMVSDGTLSTVVLGVQYLERNDIYIRIGGEDVTQSGSSTGYTWYFVDNTTLKINPVVPTGVEVYIYRRTDTSNMYNIYSQNAQFDESTVDENNQQLLFIAQEYLEQGIPGAGISSLEYINTVAGINYYRFSLTDGSYTPPFGVPDSTVQLRTELIAPTGAGLIGYQLATGKPTRTVALKLRERVTIDDFGGNGNDSADNTSAFADAVAWMIDNGRRVIIPEGSYVTDPFSVYAPSYSKQIGFVGEDKVRSVIKRLSNGAGAFVTFGNSAQTHFLGTNPLTNLTVNGGADTNGDSVVIYDWVRGVMDNVKFSGGTTALRLYGGVSCRITNYTLELAKVGFQATKYTPAVGGAGGGGPNLITLSGGEIVDNKRWGVYFDDGRMLHIRDTDIEGNGSVGLISGGLYVGASVGTEVASTTALSIGVLADNVWFESNIGVYDFGQDGGFNRLNGCTFHSVDTTNDFAATAGRYKVVDCYSTFTKTVNLKEGAGVLPGNVIDSSKFQNLSYDADKTELKAATVTNLRNGGKMSVNGYGAPRELVGQDSTAAVATITFNPPFKVGTTPRIYTQVVTDDSTASHYSVEVYGISNTGFTMRKKKITTGTATATNYYVMWRAVGEAN